MLIQTVMMAEGVDSVEVEVNPLANYQLGPLHLNRLRNAGITPVGWNRERSGGAPMDHRAMRTMDMEHGVTTERRRRSGDGKRPRFEGVQCVRRSCTRTLEGNTAMTLAKRRGMLVDYVWSFIFVSFL